MARQTKARKQITAKAYADTKIPVLSFFTGGGFLDIGFEQSGFEIVWTNEVSSQYRELYSHGYRSWRRATKRGSKLPVLESRSIKDLKANAVVRAAFQGSKPEVFGVIGGPPCPDFSRMGQHAGHRGKNGKLTSIYAKMICAIKPTFFVLENVAGLASYKKHRTHFWRIKKRLEDAGYATDYTTLNALEFGVPQHRERLFLIGFLKRKVNGHEYQNAGGEGTWFNWPVVEQYKNAEILFNWPSSNKFGATPKKPRGIPGELCVGTHMVPKSKLAITPNAENQFVPYSKKFKRVWEGDTSQKSFKRLHRHRFSPTACYGNNEVHLHPWEPRRLSLREVMRIQGVPDNYVLPDDLKLQPAYKLVSNGVPVPMAKHLAETIKSYLVENIKTTTRKN